MAEVFGRWKVLKKNTRRKFLCRCQCGNEKMVDRFSLARGDSKSCGCLSIEKTKARNLTHGMSGSNPDKKVCSFYNVWAMMKKRCCDSKVSDYNRYGGRGITVCERWQKFENFRDDMWNGFQMGLSIDRIDNDGNYEPKNCRWATKKEQANNRMSNRTIEFLGRKETIAWWSKFMGLNHRTLTQRLNNKWGVERALMTNPGYSWRHSRMESGENA